MTPERWKQVEDVFQSALDFPVERREAFLDEVCGDDATLRGQVEALIQSHDSAGSFIEAPAFAGANQFVTAPLDDPAGGMIGRRVGSYKIVRELGRGGMGAVYLAARDDAIFQKRVAIKLVKRGMDTDFILRRFRHERQILANLDHQNIARLLDGGTTDDGLPYFVMEYVEGQPIHHYCDAASLSISERLRLFRRVCAALAYAHRNQIIHRDIKPGNILVTADGTPKLLDFGIAKLLDPNLAADTIDPTQTALRLMTPEYASPEQVRGQQVTTATDTYSLGVLLYELLSGHRPYPPFSRLPHELARVISEENPERPSAVVGHADGIVMTGAVKSLGPAAVTPEVIGRCRGGVTLDALRRELAGDLDQIVLKAMCKEPASRYASVDEFSEDVRRHLEGLPVAAPSCLPMAGKAFDSDAREATTLEKSIAVLPLKMLHPVRGEDTGDSYLGLGLADAVITRLSNIRRINVRPTSSVLKYSGGDADSFAAGKELGVGYVLDGRIQRIGERIRVTVQLVSMRDGAPLWASRFDEKYTDILSLEDSLSAQVAEALVPRLTGEERERLGKRGTDNPEAFESYLRGRYHWNTYTEEGLAKAIVHFNEAIAIDPSYAAAHAGVADYFNWLGVYGVLPARECFSAAKEAAARAVELDPALAEAYASLAFTVWAYDWDWAESERLFRRAVELNPNYPQAHEWYAHVLGSAGRHPEAISEMRRAIELNPQSAALAAMFAFTLHNAHAYREGAAQLRRALDLEPNNHLALQGFGWVHDPEDTPAEALAATEKAVELSGRTHLTLWTYGHMLAVSGRRKEARRVLAELRDSARQRYVSPYCFALIHTGLGEHDEAIKWLEQAVETRDYWVVWLGVEPRFDPLRAAPRFQQLLERVGSGRTMRGASATTVIDVPPAPAARVSGVRGDATHTSDEPRAASPSHHPQTVHSQTAHPQTARPPTTHSPTAGVGAGAARFKSWNSLVAALAGAAVVALAALGWYYFKDARLFGVRRPSALTRLTGHVATDAQPKWSPDGEQIAFTTYRDGKAQIYKMDVDGKQIVRLTHNSADDSTPAWSPDGNKIAFTSKRDGNDEIYVMNADGSNQTNISNHAANDTRPAWSPDGRRILFTSDRDAREGVAGNFEIYVMDSGGGSPVRLTDNPALDSDPAWSPDGRKIAFTSNRDGNFEVYAMNPDGGEQVNLSRNPAFDGKPAWSPSGDALIAFTSNRGSDPKNFDIWIMNSGGGDPKNLTNNQAVDDEPAWSPDGSTVAFQSERDGNFEIYVVPATAAAAGGAARRVGGDAVTKSLAVLPFKASAASGEDAFLGVGLADALTARLGQLRTITVRPASAVRRYLDSTLKAHEVGREMRVDYVVHGHIERDRDRVAISFQLTDANDGSVLWSEKYDEKLTDITTMQSLIAERVTRAMTLELTGDERQMLAKRYTDNGEAYQLYLAGRYHWGKRTEEALKQAVYLFERAIERDENYALAYAGLADCHALLSWYIATPPPEAFPKAREAVMRALRLDDHLAEAHASFGFIKLYYERDWAGAEREFRRAIELNPSYATAHHWFAFNLAAVGRHDEALAEIRVAQELDPGSLFVNTAVANILYYARRYDEAIEQCQRTLEMDPGFVPAHMVLRGVYASKGMSEEADAVFQREISYAGNSPDMLARRAHLSAAAGKRAEALKALDQLRRLRRHQPLHAYEIAAVYALLKEPDEAFAWLARAEAEHSIGFAFIKVDPDLDNLRPDPRFNALLERAGLAK